ncbi:hypothetical protein FKM82_014334 [Ascaphus truei]
MDQSGTRGLRSPKLSTAPHDLECSDSSNKARNTPDNQTDLRALGLLMLCLGPYSLLSFGFFFFKSE